MLVLDGNIPRFPWEPSTTMLTYRLAGTTEVSVSYRGGRNHSGAALLEDDCKTSREFCSG